jgi:hypothetical protein
MDRTARPRGRARLEEAAEHDERRDHRRRIEEQIAASDKPHRREGERS